MVQVQQGSPKKHIQGLKVACGSHTAVTASTVKVNMCVCVTVTTNINLDPVTPSISH